MKFATVGDNCVDAYECLGTYYLSGNPVNVGVYLARMGAEVSYTGVVGDDQYGSIMIESLAKKGVDVSHVRTLPGSTAVTKVDLVNGDRVFTDYIEGVLADFKLTDEDVDFLCSHDLVITGIWGMIENDLGKIKEKGVPIAFDFSDQPEHEIVDKAISHVKYAFFSDDRGDTPELRAFMERRKAQGPDLVVVTMGDQGSLCYDGETFHKFGILPCEVVDTMGAGDSYIAGFLLAHMNGHSIEECMIKGAESSGVTLGYQGAW